MVDRVPVVGILGFADDCCCLVESVSAKLGMLCS